MSTRSGTTLTRIGLAAISGLGAYLLLLGHRTDYAGHFTAGFAGTLLLLVLPLASLRPRLRWEPLAIAVIAIALGAVLEATMFRIAIFDPVDFANQSLGAAAAAAAVTNRPATRVAAVGAGGMGLVLLVVGFVLAFA